MATGFDPERAATINALYRKSNDLMHLSQILSAVGPHSPNPVQIQQEAGAAYQESYYCSAKAHALQANNPYSYPGPAVIAQCMAACQALEQAVANSAGWAAVIAAGNTVIQTMPADSI